MSIVKTGVLKKRDCGNALPYSCGIWDSLGGNVNLQIVGTDPTGSLRNGAALIDDYSPADDPDGTINKNADGTFLICIETDAATYFVSLGDGSDFIITPTQSTAYLGQFWPGRIMSVNVGSTGWFSVGY